MARKAPAPKEKAPKEKAGGRGIVWIQGLACGACAAVAPTASAMLAVLLAPAIVALLLDRQKGKPVGRAVLLCGSVACVGPMTTFWHMGGGVGFALLGDPGVYGPAWAACAGGWLATQLMPIGIRGILEAASLSRTARLRGERERLLQDWGLDGQ